MEISISELNFAHDFQKWFQKLAKRIGVNIDTLFRDLINGGGVCEFSDGEREWSRVSFEMYVEDKYEQFRLETPSSGALSGLVVEDPPKQRKSAIKVQTRSSQVKCKCRYCHLQDHEICCCLKRMEQKCTFCMEKGHIEKYCKATVSKLKNGSVTIHRAHPKVKCRGKCLSPTGSLKSLDEMTFADMHEMAMKQEKAYQRVKEENGGVWPYQPPSDDE